MECPRCKTKLEGRFKFCPECGSNISAVSGASDQEQGEVSLGDLRTIAPEGAIGPGGEESIGDLRTLAGPGEKSGTGLTDGENFAERYELIEEIGRGGFAAVWKAKDKKLGRTVAVKKLHPEHDGMAAARFKREAQSIAQLNHRNIVQVYDVGEQAGEIWLVMELIEGGSLRDLLKQKGKLALDEALPLFKGIAQGLAYAHRKNLVHRDIKPANILLASDNASSVESGRLDVGSSPHNRSPINDNFIPKIVDFGLAQAGRDSELSMSGYGMGTPYYMPPEQRRDAKSVNHTADIYALGKVLYEMLSGQIPDTLDPEEIPPPHALAQIIFKCTKPKPEDRYFSVDDLLRELEGIGTLNLKPKAQRLVPVTNNACPACGAENEVDVKFCGACGTGLTRICPECGRENSIHKQFCGGCGTDVEGFLAAEDTLQRMEKYTDEEKWSRVLKEAEGLDKTVRLPGEKGAALIALVLEGESQARQVLSEIGRIEKELAGMESSPPAESCTDELKYFQNRHQLMTKLGKLHPLTGEQQNECMQLQEKIDAAQAECTRVATEVRRIRLRKLLNNLNLDDHNGDYAPLDGLAPGSAEAQERQKVIVNMGLPLEAQSKITGIAFRLVRAGTFTMGSPSGESGRDDDEKQHAVTLTKPFYCGKFKVTQGQWEEVMGSNPSHFKNAGSDAPVESVSWEDCQTFLEKLCELEGVPQGTYRLLTEAQWEYACRAGTQTPFYFGDRLDSTMANFDGNYPYGGASKGPYRKITTPVGQFKPNSFGLYDMHGNVWEWCNDWYGVYGSGSVTDPVGPTSCSYRVLRGGSWGRNARHCRSAGRDWSTPGNRGNSLGFRIMCVI